MTNSEQSVSRSYGHGTESMYTHGRCRCSSCREANRLARQRRRLAEDRAEIRAKWRAEKARQRGTRS